MAYVAELSIGQSVYIDDRDGQTLVILASNHPGQQQQMSSSFATGGWIAPPEMFDIPNGIAVRITTATGVQIVQIQGSSVSIVSDGRFLNGLQPQPMQQTASAPPMSPMPPMTLGNMQMSMNPMEMRMGDMNLRMDNTPKTAGTSRFCSQCGVPVHPQDRFCSSCGNRLQP
jgi:hypothetical protein